MARMAGKQLPGAKVSTCPNQLLDKGGTCILGNCFPSTRVIRAQIAGERIDFPMAQSLQPSPYVRTTNENGIAVLRPIPIGTAQSVGLWHDSYVLKQERKRRVFGGRDYVLHNSDPTKITLETVLIETEQEAASAD